MRQPRHSHSTESPPLRLKDFPEKIRGEQMVSCRLCGTEWRRILVPLESGSVEPQTDESITGASSGDTGVVVEYKLLSGSFAGGDAVGELMLKNATGVNVSGWWGTKSEALNGSVGGNDIMTLSWEGIEQVHGIKYPLSHMVKYNGVWYCAPHAKFKQESDEKKKIELNVGDLESERGVLP